MKHIKLLVTGLLLSLTLLFGGCSPDSSSESPSQTSDREASYNLESIPEYTGDPYVVINENVPFFTESDFTEEAFETYSDLDELGRCGAAFANVGKETMPTEERGQIGMIKPSGWQTVKYDCVDGKYLYNRCHLIGYQLSAENANEKNLITGTRYLNVSGMLPFENMVADYIKNTGNHVLYRITPIYQDKNLVASGVLMEAQSVEDDTIRFCVYCYNVQPGIQIDYATGKSSLAAGSEEASKAPDQEATYILNENSKKIHTPDCPSVQDTKPKNRKEYRGLLQELLDDGYTGCKNCNP